MLVRQPHHIHNLLTKPINGKPSSRSGFTLVELSIVLVIIGLLIGGILVGQDLIMISKRNIVIKEINEYSTLIRLYKDRFRHLPGDDPNAAKHFGPTCGTGFRNQCEGNGDGQINYSSLETGEVLRVFEHLSFSGLLDKSYKSTNAGNVYCPAGVCPVSEISDVKTGNRALTYKVRYGSLGCCGGSSMAGGNYNSIMLFDVRGHNSYPTWGIKPILASMLDHKLDDGVPTTGNVTATNFFNWVSVPPEFSNEPSPVCRFNDRYHVERKEKRCIVSFKIENLN